MVSDLLYSVTLELSEARFAENKFRTWPPRFLPQISSSTVTTSGGLISDKLQKL